MKRFFPPHIPCLPVALAPLLFLSPTLHADNWESHRIAEGRSNIPEDLEIFSLIAISGDGSVVAGTEVGDWNTFPNAGPSKYRYQYPFYWKQGMEFIVEIRPNTDQIITYPNGYKGRVTGLSRDGNWVVGEYATAHEKGFHEAFLYSIENDLFEYLGDLGWKEQGDPGQVPDGYLASVATGVSADGSVVVGWARTGQQFRAFRWTRETGMNLVYDNIPLWNDKLEDRALAVSRDGIRIAGDYSRLVRPNSEERAYGAFFTDKPNVLHPIALPKDYFLQERVEISGPDNALLGSVRVEDLGGSEPSWFNPPYQQSGFLWRPEQDSYVLYPEFNQSKQLTALSQTDDGRLITLEYLGIAPTDGSADYGILWTPDTGMMDATQFLRDRYDIDFGNGAVSTLLPSGDGKVLIAEVYTDSGHYQKALAAFNLTKPISPLASLFPGSTYADGWRITSLGSFNVDKYPYLMWKNFGWVYLHPASNPDVAVWMWNQDLGWFAAKAVYQNQIYAYDPGEWITVDIADGWLYGKSRHWFRLLD